MASSSSYSSKTNKNKNKSPVNAGSFDNDPQIENTTFVRADPSNFRDVVQKLTGSSTDPTVQTLPIIISPRPSIGKYHSVEVGPMRPSFMLQERRQNGTNLAIQLNQNEASHGQYAFFPGKRMMDASPVSTLDMLSARGSPRTPMSPSVQEERAIANKGFHLHPSPLGTSTKAEPELLNLFPKAAEPELLNLFPTSTDS